MRIKSQRITIEEAIAKDSAHSPTKWLTLFRSKDAALWNTNTKRGPNDFAMKLDAAPNRMRYLRMTLGNAAVIIPLSKQELGSKAAGVAFKWCGEASEMWRGRHLGIGIKPASTGIACVACWPDAQTGKHLTGYGFGHRYNGADRQGYCWEGKEVDAQVIEISVTDKELQPEEALSMIR